MSIRHLLPVDEELARTLADNAIGLFLEYRDAYGYDEDGARSAAVRDVIEGAATVLDKEGPAVPPSPSRGARDYWSARGLPVPGADE